MRDVLFLSYFFPPLGGGAVLRALKFAKYLPAFGWRPLVVGGLGAYQVYDETLMAEVPPDAVVKRAWPGGRVAEDGPAGLAATPASSRSFVARTQRRLLKPLKKFFYFPDAYAPYAAGARAAALRLLEEYDAAAVFSTAPPYTFHIVAAEVAAASSLPLVLDYRDAWSENPFDRAPTPLHARRARRAEEGVLARASAVVAVTEGMAAAYKPRVAAETPVLFLPNGYDEADFAAAAPAGDGRFTVTYAGQFYGGRMPWTFLAAAAAFVERAALAPGDFVFRLLGPVGPSVLGRAASYGVTVEAPGVLGHREAVAAMRAADVNLLVIGDEPGAGATLTGKVFEYLRAGRPILALVPPEGEAAALITRFGAGAVVAPDDVAGAARALEAFYGRRGRPARAAAPGLERFERKRLTGELASLLDDVSRR